MTQHTQQATRAVAVLHIGTRAQNRQQESQNIHQDGAFAAFDPFATIKSFDPATLGRFHRLSINAASAGLAIAAFQDAHIASQGVIHMLPGAIAAPLAEIVVNNATWRQIVREQAPGTATTDDV
jgi:hypothetical protein